MDDAAPGRHPVHCARANGHLRAEAVAVQDFAIEQISDGRKVDVRMRAYVDALAQDELSGSHLVEEDKGPHHLALGAGECATHLETTKIAGTRNDHGFDQISGTGVAWGGIGAWLPAHDFFLGSRR